MTVDRVLPPVEGSAEAVRALAATLTSGAARLSSIAAVLAGIRGGASWESPAGEAFGAAVRSSPPLLDALIHRYAGAAAALRSFAEVHEQAQAQARAASSTYAEHLAVHRGIEVQMDFAAGDAARLEVLRQQSMHVLHRLRDAEMAHASATAEFAEAGLVLARRLRALADDILDDSWHYRAFASADEAAGSVEAGVEWLGEVVPGSGLAAGKVPGLSQALAATAAVGGVSRAALAVAYDEGSVREVAVRAATAAGLQVGGGLLRGSQAGAVQRRVGGRAVASGRPAMTARERALAGARAQWASSPLGFRTKVVAAAPVSPTKVSGRLPWRERARDLARQRLDASLVGQWRLAAAGGPTAQKMFVPGATLEKALPAARNLALAEKPDEHASRTDLSLGACPSPDPSPPTGDPSTPRG